MTPAEFKCTREFLGLPVDWLADHLGVSVRSVARWESGEHKIPAGVAEEVGLLREEASVRVSHVTRRFEPPTRVTTYRMDADFAATGEIDYPASWHRAICARIADQVPGVRIEYVS